MDPQASPATKLLTPRQLEVLELMAKGLTNPEIADVLGIARGTVKVHVSAVIEALDVTNRTEAAMALQELQQERTEPDDRVPGFGERPAIAVLPFDDLAPETSLPGLADGLSEDLITGIAAWRWFPVIARNSTFRYRGRAVDVAQVARELGARFVIEGSVRHAGGRVRVNVQVIDGPTGQHVFAERFDREVRDVFELQDQIVEQVVGALEPTLTRIEGLRARRLPPGSLGVWEHFQRGLALMWDQQHDEIDDACRSLERALEEDADFAPAHAALALALNTRVIYRSGDIAGGDGPTILAAIVQDLERAREIAQRALALDPFDAIAHLAAAGVAGLTGDMAAGRAAVERALELNPSLAVGYWAWGNTLLSSGDYEAAAEAYERAARLSPRDGMLHHFHGGLAGALLGCRRLEECAVAARRSEETRTGTGISYRPTLVVALAELGRLDEAREEAKAVYEWGPALDLTPARMLVPDDLLERVRAAFVSLDLPVSG